MTAHDDYNREQREHREELARRIAAAQPVGYPLRRDLAAMFPNAGATDGREVARWVRPHTCPGCGAVCPSALATIDPASRCARCIPAHRPKSAV